MDIQLVHASVLTVGHYAHNKENKVTTVVLLDSCSPIDVEKFLDQFEQKVKHSMPAAVVSDIVGYCYGTQTKLNSLKLYMNVSRYLSTCYKKVLGHNPEWH